MRFLCEEHGYRKRPEYPVKTPHGCNAGQPRSRTGAGELWSMSIASLNPPYRLDRVIPAKDGRTDGKPLI